MCAAASGSVTGAGTARVRKIAVIGAAFGDEGKGHLTDYFAAEAPDPPLVIRYNGGCQAGHTVVTPDGTRHVFGHFGSGTLAGSPTMLSRFFIVNPMIWAAERDVLRNLGYDPKVYVDRRAPLTTPYDMVANRVLAKHGTCGLGIHETLARSIPTTVETPGMRDICLQIREVTRERLAGHMTEEHLEWINSDTLLENYLYDLGELRRSCILTDEIPVWSGYIFEGAQGLMLDEKHQYFPYVTHSRTGLPNIVKLCDEIGIDDLDVVYVTRSYVTRHGPGPFPTEDPHLSYEDTTNVPNPHQGVLRFGHLYPFTLMKTIDDDLAHCGRLSVNPVLAVTCLDQHNNTPDIPQLPVIYRSHGPRRNDIWR